MLLQEAAETLPHLVQVQGRLDLHNEESLVDLARNEQSESLELPLHFSNQDQQLPTGRLTQNALLSDKDHLADR